MTGTARAKVFMSGRSQAVRIPKEFRLDATEVAIRRQGDALILEPVDAKLDTEAVFKAIDDLLAGKEFTPDGREQPDWPPERPNMFDEPDAYLESFKDPKYDYPAPPAKARKRG